MVRFYIHLCPRTSYLSHPDLQSLSDCLGIANFHCNPAYSPTSLPNPDATPSKGHSARYSLTNEDGGLCCPSTTHSYSTLHFHPYYLPYQHLLYQERPCRFVRFREAVIFRRSSSSDADHLVQNLTYNLNPALVLWKAQNSLLTLSYFAHFRQDYQQRYTCSARSCA